MLSVESIDLYYGNIQALRAVSFFVERGEIVSLIGANGAGKSTTLKAIAGVLSPRSGSILLEGERIDGMARHRVVRKGICLVPEGRGIFAEMTVRENLEMGGYTRRSDAEVEEGIARVFELFPRLAERVQQPAGTLSGGEQQMLAIGRALVANPRLLLLDEPSMGLAPLLVREIFRMIGRIHRAGTTVLLVEQNAHMALSIADRAYVLENGEITLSGEASTLRSDPRVRSAYLGDLPDEGREQFPR
ncbi:MAG: ABC transporter ATP-binding protein [Deltaproteobacteria bacterium]